MFVMQQQHRLLSKIKNAETDLLVKDKLIASNCCFAEAEIDVYTYVVVATALLLAVKFVKLAVVGKLVR